MASNPLKNNPYTLVRNFQRTISPETLSKPQPVWIPSVQMVPPQRFIPFRVIPKEVGTFSESHLQAPKSSPARPAAHGNYMPKHTRKQPKLPPKTYIDHIPKIIYPEDEIRQAFYLHHPIELASGRDLTAPHVESRDWSNIRGGQLTSKVTGENVVQRTLYLMSSQSQSKLTRHDAYKIALGEFYAVRAAEEKPLLARYEQSLRSEEAANATGKYRSNTSSSTSDAQAQPAPPVEHKTPAWDRFCRDERKHLEETMLHMAKARAELNKQIDNNM